MTSTPEGKKKIRNFLLNAFDTNQLGRFIDDWYPSLSSSINFNASPDGVAEDLVEVLERHGLLDFSFAEALARERPNRSAEIDEVRSALGLTKSVVRNPGSDTAGPQSGEWDIFLAHSSREKPRVRELHEALRLISRYPEPRIFFDEVSISPGADWRKSVSDALERSAIAVLVVSEDSQNRWYLESELARLIERQRDNEVRIIPVFLDGFRVGAVPYVIAQLQGLDASALGMAEVARRIFSVLDSVNEGG